MTLRLQLLGVGLLTLVLPWSGYRYVLELESALRDGLEETLRTNAATLANALAASPLSDAELRGPAQTIYAPPLSAAPALDGYFSDWTIAASAARELSADSRFWTAVHERSLYVFVESIDASRVNQRTPTERPYGDRVVIRVGSAEPTWLLLQTTAQGLVRAQATAPPAYAPTSRFDDRIVAYWRETSNGFAIEARVPLELIDRRLGVGFIDVDAPASTGPAPTLSDYAVRLDSSWDDDGSFANPLFIRPRALQAQVGRFSQAGRRLRIVDRDGWILYDGGAIDPLEQVLARPPLGATEQLLRMILAPADPPYAEIERPAGYLANAELRSAMPSGGVSWFARGTSESAIVVAVEPVIRDAAFDGAVIIEQASDAILTLTNGALVELMSFTLLASLLVAIGLLSYATYLSIRIRRLASAADSAMGPKGEIDPQLPERRARDEIGDLSRSFTALLGRLRDHTNYLTTLKGKLAHELRTPLAVVTTSLENVEREPHGAHLDPYLERMRDGTSRLDGILAAMSEATALERAIDDSTRERFALDAVVRGCVAGYRDVYRDRHFSYVAADGDSDIEGSADLIAQMLDKLVDNAVGFSPVGSTIQIRLDESPSSLKLTVTNTGPRLPESMRASIFGSLVSLRDESETRGHLGLGLYVVALIAKFHGATADAIDLPDGTGVSFSVTIPRAAMPRT